MRGAVAERRRADFDIPAALPRVCSHIRGADAGWSAISRGQWWFGARGFEGGAVNWVLDPFLAERFLLPLRLRSATAHVWTHVLICVEANFPPAPARARPRMCERTFRKMTWWNYEHHQPWNWPSLTKILQVQHQNVFQYCISDKEMLLTIPHISLSILIEILLITHCHVIYSTESQQPVPMSVFS